MNIIFYDYFARNRREFKEENQAIYKEIYIRIFPFQHQFAAINSQRHGQPFYSSVSDLLNKKGFTVYLPETYPDLGQFTEETYFRIQLSLNNDFVYTVPISDEDFQSIMW